MKKWPLWEKLLFAAFLFWGGAGLIFTCGRISPDVAGPWLRDFVAGRSDAAALAAASREIAAVANRHRGSDSIDGCAHAAVSSTFAAANALAGRPLEAGSYAAYAAVYAYGGYAINDPTAFEPEFEWQVAQLHRLAAEYPPAPGPTQSPASRGATS